MTDDFEGAIKRAKQQDKLVFIDTYASWCQPCKKQEPVFRDKDLADFFNNNFINVKVDMDKRLGKALALKYSVVFLPTLMILDGNGNVKYRSDQSTSAAIVSVNELLRIGIDARFPNHRVASTSKPTNSTTTSTKPISSTSSTATVVAQQAPKTTEPKYRHVQHTPLDRYNNNDEIAETASSQTKEVKAQTSTTVATAKPNKTNVETESGEKILYVLGEGDDLPPEVLREEAYFRLSLMDGSHKETVKKYLQTQKDWGTEENMKFLFDFLYTSRSDEFTYLIINRHKFEKLLGKEKVANSINILVNQTLERAIPRPDRKEAQALYSYLNNRTSKEKALKYYLKNAYREEKIDEYIPLAKEYLEKMNPSDTEVMEDLANTIAEYGKDKKDYKYGIKLIDKCIKIRGKQFRYLDTKSFLYLSLGEKKKATSTAYEAIATAKARNIDYSSTTELLKLIDDL